MICGLEREGGTRSSHKFRIGRLAGSPQTIIHSILKGSIELSDFDNDNIFGLDVPKNLVGINNNILNPRELWIDKNQYDDISISLAKKFVDNFNSYGIEVKHLEPFGPKLEKKLI